MTRTKSVVCAGIRRYAGSRRYLPLVLLCGIILAGCSLSAPPPERGNAPLVTPLAPQADVPVEMPSRQPSVANGAPLYAEKCTGCHGPTGHGDGERAEQIQQQTGVAPADLTAESVRASTPAEWFSIITAGRIERLMPPFSGSLSVDDRWDVIAYVWSLGATESTLATGKAVYTDRCVQCHGQAGKGDGPQASGKLIDLSDLNTYRDVAPGAWDNAIDSTHVPTFAGKLSPDERAAVIDYVRSFAYDTAAAVAAATPPATPGPGGTPNTSTAPTAQPATEGITINGSVVNGTAGGPTPGGFDATFYHFPGGTSATPITQTVRVDATGHFTVTNLSAQAGDVVAVLALYGDMSYPSELVTLDGSARTVDLPLKVYEQTTSTETIRIATLHIIATQTSGALDVTEIYVMSNTGDRAVANTTGSPTLRFNLPAAATGFRGMSETTGLYAETPEGFDYYEAVPPGSSTAQVVVAYQLPLSGDAIFDRAPTYPIDTVNLLVQAADLKPSSTQLLDQGPRDFQGQTYQLFTGGPFESGPMLAFRLSGAAAGVDVKLIAAGVLLVAGVAGIGYGLWRRRAEQKPQPATVSVTASARGRKPQAAKVSPADRDRLIDEIAALDDAFDAGQIAQADYTRRREALKAKLLRQTGDD